MKLRYFFDPGSGICLWAADDEAIAAFGYPVKLEELPLSKELLASGNQLIGWFDTSIDWEYPPNPTPWSIAERAEFMAASQDFYQRLISELGPGYELVNEVKV